MNKKILTPLFVAASFLLIGCSTSEIISRPSWINESIISGDLKDNKLKDIYDAIKKLGDTNANVLNKVMYDIAQKHIGTYEELKKFGETNATPTNEEIDEFVKNHPTYASENQAYVLENGEPVKKDITDNADEKRKISLGKIQEQYKRLKEDIYRKFHDEIKGGSYSTKIDKYFQEEYFIHHLYTEMYHDGDPKKEPSKKATDRVFIPKTKDQSWEDYVEAKDSDTDPTKNTGFIHLTTDEGKFYGCYQEYIDRKILPEIYRTLLIENYVREQRATNLGRSYARKVNMISVPTNSSSSISDKIYQLMLKFVETNISGNDGIKDYNLEHIKDAMVGFAATGTAKDMLEGSNFTHLPVYTVNAGKKDLIWQIRTNYLGVAIEDISGVTAYEGTYVYEGTKLYDLAQKYISIMDVTYDPQAGSPSYNDFKFKLKEHFTSDEQAAYDDLTNKGAYPVEKGVILKERELRQTDMTTDGWFLKSGGISDLSEDSKNNLFKITTSQIIDNRTTNEPKLGDTVRYFGKPGNRKAFVYLPGEGKPSDAATIIDDSTSNFYIVEVEEACSASKLATEGANGSYAELRATDVLGASNIKMNEIIGKVTEQVANSDTYKKNAEQYYLMISNILFYDQSVYDYFKSQFPDLFK